MAKYFNTTRGPIAVALASGGSLTVPPKTWIEISAADEGSPNLVPLRRKGYLKRSAIETEVPVPTIVAAPLESTRTEVVEDPPKIEASKDGVKIEVRKK